MKLEEELRQRITELENKERTRERKEIITEWLHTKCIWAWTLLLGWLFTVGIFIVEHYEKVAAVLMAAFKALKETNK